MKLIISVKRTSQNNIILIIMSYTFDRLQYSAEYTFYVLDYFTVLDY